MTLTTLRDKTGRPLIVAHRGTASGMVFPNTVAAGKAAVAAGADIVELDVIRSTDGVYYAFHDGYESLYFGVSTSILDMTSDEIDELRFGKVLGGNGVAGLERYHDIVRALAGVPINVDRSWRYWGSGFLGELAGWGEPDYLLLKSPVVEEALEALAACRTPFPYLAMVKSPEDIEAVSARDGINLVGVELLPDGPDHPFADSDYVRGLRERGLLTWVNALNLENLKPLFCGWDDEVSVSENPEDGWGRLASIGADIIQTDWPWMLRPFLDQRMEQWQRSN